MGLTHRSIGLGLGVLGAATILATLGAACSSRESGSNSSSGGDGGSGTGGDASSTTGTSTSTTGVGGGAPCEGTEATIADVTTGVVGVGVKVKLTDLVVMSQKFLVSQGSSSGSCLWGVFVSAPGLAETAENSGMLVLDYGFDATTDDGGDKAYCPKLGEEETGDDIPDNLRPGDVIDVIGETANFLLSNCASETNGSTVGQFQIAKSCSIERHGTAPVPAAHVFTAAELEDIGSPSKQSFHDRWGGVKIRVENVTALPAADGGAVGDYGVITLNEGPIEVSDKVYYRAYLKSQNYCHAAPVFASTLSFNAVEGFSYLDYCTWRIAPNDKCADFDPSSEDCQGALTCPPTEM